MTIKNALIEGRSTLSEHESKQVLSEYNIPVTKEINIYHQEELMPAAEKIGYPLVMKGCSPDILHKTEQNLVVTDIRNPVEAETAFGNIVSNMATEGSVLVQEMIQGNRELVAGMIRDPQFGPCVMFGIGGIFTEILEDVSFRIAPLTMNDAHALMKDIRGKKILDAVRGMPPADRNALADILVTVGQIGIDHTEIKEIDINPIKLPKGNPVAVDALIVLNHEKHQVKRQ